MDDSPEEAGFRKPVFYVRLENVTGGLTVHFHAAGNVSEKFSFLWKHPSIPQVGLKEKSELLADQYPADISEDLVTERSHLPSVHQANLGEGQPNPLELLNCLKRYKLEGLFPNIGVCLRILLTIPATVASAESSFSKRKLIKNDPRSTMSQQGRLVDLARLRIESDLAKTMDFDEVIHNFARKKARKAPLFSRI